MQRAALAALTLAATAGIQPTVAQQAPEIATLTATISQSAVADSNYNLDDPSPGTSYYGDTRFALDYYRDTATQTLGFGIDTGIRPLWQADQDFEVVVASPSTANFDFTQEGPNTDFNVGARLRTRRVDSTGPIDIDGPLPDDLTGFQQDSTEYRTDADLGFTLGTNSPSSYAFTVAATNFDYSQDTGRNNLVPRRSVEGAATWTLQITPVFATVAAAGYYWYSSDNPTEDEVTVAEGDFGIAYTPTENLRIRGGLGYADRKRDQTINDVRDTTEHNTGPTVRGDIRYVQPNFTLFGEARWTTAAPTDRLSGVLRGFYNLNRGQVTGRIFQRYGGGQGGNDQRITGAGIGFLHELTQVSRVNLDASYAVQSNEDNPDAPDIDRTDLTASYIHDLTQTVSAEIGYGYRHRIEDPEDAISNRVFLIIGKTFETGL
jgi:hypothetical protein